MTRTPVEELDALVIGAGITGLYQLYCLLQIGLDAKIYDAADGVGGTWYWNRYPGARLDSESWSYGYSFSEELLRDWSWTENFVAQPELERYLNHVADRFELRPHIRLGTRVCSMRFDEEANRWEIETEDGRRARARFVVAATGLLSAHYLPDIPGIDAFEGESFHTARWPHEPIDFSGKRVGVIGTGSTGVQVITEVAKECGHLTVFQRTPNYCSPLGNSPISPGEMEEIKERYPEIFATCRQNVGGFVHNPDPRSTFDVSAEERLQFYEDVWGRPGFSKWFGNFRDLMTDREANEIFCEFVREKIRERVDDPEVAEKLCPKDYHYGAKRIPLESGYYETYNRDNVTLVDVREDPIERVTAQGVETQSGLHELDVLIFATGFDAATGEVTRMDIRGVGGETIQERWAGGATMYLGLQTAGFPNLFFENGALFCNFTRCAEAVAEFVRDLLAYMRAHGHERVEPDPAAEARWMDQSRALSADRLRSDVTSWGDGTNIPGKPAFQIYTGGFDAFLKVCEEVVAGGYEGLELS